MMPAMTRKSPNEKRVEQFQKGMENNLDQIEQVLIYQINSLAIYFNTRCYD